MKAAAEALSLSREEQTGRRGRVGAGFRFLEKILPGKGEVPQHCLARGLSLLVPE